ncbi:MAG: carbohydrate ABC transporter permease [Anaerolineales bacterium]
MLNSRMQEFRRLFNVSTLTFRLWNFTGTALLNLLLWVAVLAYLSPLSYMVATALKTSAQLGDSSAPILPSKAITFTYQGTEYSVYEVPTENGVKQWALVNYFRKYSEFIDPANPDAGLIHWEGSWRSLAKAYTPSVTFNNFVTLWNSIDYPLRLRNSLIVVGLAELGVLCSSILVAYGFARFRIPGSKYLFFLCIATIMIPDSITLVPSFVIYTRVLNWNGSFLPLIVPQFFGSAIYIFLLRQNFKTIPREMDEAAMLDGAGPLRTLISIILPQAVPVVVTVALLQFFNMWNEMRMSSLYLSARQDLWTMPYTAQAFITFGFTAEMLQASALILIIVPVVVLFVAQRFFMQDMIVTGIEK